jgi:hypothetical protein
VSVFLAALRRRVAVPALVVLTLTLSASAADGEWQVVPSPSPDSPVAGFADVAAASATDAWAVGSYFDPGQGRHGADRTLVERWNGAQWSIVQTPEFGDGYSQLSGVTAISRKNVWAVGSFTKEFTQRSLVLRFNGRRWSRVGVPDPEQWDDLSDISAVSSRDIWAIGNAYLGGFVIHWDGRAWRSVEAPIGWLSAVHAVGPDDVWIVGQRAPAQDSGSDDVIYRSLAAHWDGVDWTVVDTPNLPFHFNLLNEISGTGANDLWAVGSANDSTKPHRPLILHWDGTAWRLVPPAETGATNAELFGVTTVRADLAWAVGRADGAALIERWDGESWSAVPVPDAGVEEVLAGVARIPGGGAWAAGSTRVGQPRKTLTLRSAIE